MQQKHSIGSGCLRWHRGCGCYYCCLCLCLCFCVCFCLCFCYQAPLVEVVAVMVVVVLAYWGEWCANFRLATRAGHGEDIWAQQGDTRLGVGKMIRGRFGGG